MADWFLETGLYLLGVALIPAVGLLLACWGLWGDRSKGRPRCPKCWYDMRGSLPRLECNECGHDAKQERRLHRNRRGRRRIVVGVLLVLVFSYPLAIVGGWCREQAVIRSLFGVQNSQPAPIGPDWLVGRLPDGFARFFERQTSVSVASDEELAVCGKLRHLQKIMARSPGVTDAGLEHLQGLAQLKHVRLYYTSVTDAGLVHLKGLAQLSTLDLCGTKVTDAGLVHMKELSGLRLLDLSHTNVADAGLVHLKGLTQLQRLHLSVTQVTDAGLAHLTEMPQLQRLELLYTRVTDAGLVHLKGLSQLRELDLRNTSVTDTGVAGLRQALPNVNVSRREVYETPVEMGIPPQRPPPTSP